MESKGFEMRARLCWCAVPALSMCWCVDKLCCTYATRFPRTKVDVSFRSTISSRSIVFPWNSPAR